MNVTNIDIPLLFFHLIYLLIKGTKKHNFYISTRCLFHKDNSCLVRKIDQFLIFQVIKPNTASF